MNSTLQTVSALVSLDVISTLVSERCTPLFVSYYLIAFSNGSERERGQRNGHWNQNRSCTEGLLAWIIEVQAINIMLLVQRLNHNCSVGEMSNLVSS